MDSANVLDIFTCGICLETFDESSKCPRILSCGHSFCHSCLVKLLAQRPCCPTCKAEILFQSIETIPINFSLKSLINIRSHILVPNASSNREGRINDTTQTSDAAKCEPITSNSKYLSEGYCDEHNIYKGMRCMDGEVWICGMCSSLHHKQCRTLLVEEAFKELKQKVSQKVEEELDQKKTSAVRLTESLKVLEEDRRSLIDEIKRKELELKDREQRIEELKSLKADQKKFCDQLKQQQTMVHDSANDAEFSKNLIELENLLQEGKKQILFDLPLRHLPQTLEALGTLCQNRSVYAVEDRYDGTRYGKVALKDGRILVDSFQLEMPVDATFLNLPELLSRFNNGSSELPKTVFLRVTPDEYDSEEDDVDVEDSFDVIIVTDGFTPRAKNFILLCSALKGPSYKGEDMEGDSSCYDINTEIPPVVEGIGNDDPETLLKKGWVHGMGEGNSWFQIQLEDQSSHSGSQFGVVVAGLQQLKDLRERNSSIEECGLVI